MEIDHITDEAEKVSVFARFPHTGAEGAVLKRLDAPYTPNHQSSGGDQRKLKFVETATESGVCRQAICIPRNPGYAASA